MAEGWALKVGGTTPGAIRVGAKPPPKTTPLQAPERLCITKILYLIKLKFST